MKAHWQKEKELIQAIRTIKERAGAARHRRPAWRSGRGIWRGWRKSATARLIAAAEGAGGSQPQAGRSCRQDSKMLKEEVDDEDVAEVVSRWTGIPVSRMLEGEREKLVHMEERLRPAGDRPGGGRRRGVQRRAPGPLRPAGPQPAHRAPSFSWAPPASARPNWPRPWPSSSSTTSRPWCGSTCPNTWKSTRSSRLIGAPPGYVGYEEGG